MIKGKFTKYTPTNEKLLADADSIKQITGMDIIFLQSENGEDWYEIQSEFSRDTVKIVFGENKVITSYSRDVSSLNPINSFVAEISEGDFPNGVDILGGWQFDGAKVVKINPDPLGENRSKKQRLMTEAAAEIAPLQDAVDLSIATEQETLSLMEWKKYRILLSRVDPNNPDWPRKPAKD
ncbi:tail fiber assembly protein [Enterobacter bugandensis]|uniref:tail fiber assembly protein n=1 Tax=Enterobacter bugandensis TaxID=881260 RepID=UPI003076383A